MKLKLRSRDLRYFLTFVIVMTVLSSGVSYRVLNPPSGEPYFAMWILGPNGFAQDYYPTDNPNLVINEQLNWTVGIQNEMGDLQYVVVLVKLLNATMVGPVSDVGSPSPSVPILQFTRVLVNNETWSVSFDWMILNATQQDGSTIITRLLVDGNELTGDFAVARSGLNFRWVFELWFYDASAGNLAFSQPTNVGSRSVWTQIWFNATYVV